MKAIVATQYGGPEVLQLQEMDKPTLADNEVLIRIHATTVTAAHTMMRRGKPLFGRLFTGFSKPKHPVPGTELAGEVEAVGKDVTRFAVGDRVYGATDLDGGGYAEYKALTEGDVMDVMPPALTYDEAASILDGTLTALHFLRDKGQVQPGQRVLINGASGSVGSAAVQVAKHFSTHVTGVCSTANVEMVKSLGADAVIDYTQEDFTQNGQTYDIIFDAVGKSSFSRSKNSLAEHGIFLSTVLAPTILWQTLWTSMVGNKKAVLAFAGLRSSEEKMADMQLLKDLVESGDIQPVIDRRYALEEIAEAHRYVDKGHKKGNVVITVA